MTSAVGGRVTTLSRILILNEVLPERLRAKLEADARKRDMLLNDCACAILCEHYGLECATSGLPYRDGAAERFKLRVPEQLRQAIAVDAAESGATLRGVALNILASHYRLAAIDTHRRPRSVA